MRWPVLATSANLHGGPDPRTLDEVPAPLRAEVDLLLDGGPLAGTPSTVVDLSRFEGEGRWGIVREGAVSGAAVERATGVPPTLEG
jgi:L-threonylcarbamoyladenylate synthase